MCLNAQKLSLLDIKWRCHQTTSAYDGQNLGSLNFMWILVNDHLHSFSTLFRYFICNKWLMPVFNMRIALKHT